MSKPKPVDPRTAAYKKRMQGQARGTTADHTFPNRTAALDNANRLVNSHQITKSNFTNIEREIERECAKRPNGSN